MKKRPLQVVLHVREPSIIELAVGERVQLDRLTPSSRGSIPARHGGLLEPGKATMALAEGHYCFKTLSDARLHVVRGGVDVERVAQRDKKPPIESVDPSPPPPKGDEPDGEMPTLTVE